MCPLRGTIYCRVRLVIKGRRARLLCPSITHIIVLISSSVCTLITIRNRSIKARGELGLPKQNSKRTCMTSMREEQIQQQDEQTKKPPIDARWCTLSLSRQFIDSVRRESAQLADGAGCSIEGWIRQGEPPKTPQTTLRLASVSPMRPRRRTRNQQSDPHRRPTPAPRSTSHSSTRPPNRPSWTRWPQEMLRLPCRVPASASPAGWGPALCSRFDPVPPPPRLATSVSCNPLF